MLQAIRSHFVSAQHTPISNLLKMLAFDLGEIIPGPIVYLPPKVYRKQGTFVNSSSGPRGPVSTSGNQTP